jgi:hypothetical protein
MHLYKHNEALYSYWKVFVESFLFFYYWARADAQRVPRLEKGSYPRLKERERDQQEVDNRFLGSLPVNG